MDTNVAIIGLVIQGTAFIAGGLWFAMEQKSSNNIMKGEVKHIRESLDELKDNTKVVATKVGDHEVRMQLLEKATHK